MSFSHAVLWMDHQEGVLVRFNSTSHETEHLRAYEGKENLHSRAGTLGDGKSKTHPDYFPKLARAIDTVDAALVLGAGIARKEFLNYLDDASPSIRAKILGAESSERITEAQLLAFAKNWFIPVDSMRGFN
jgi:stalled ribosome rescue protein Dom34